MNASNFLREQTHATTPARFLSSLTEVDLGRTGSRSNVRLSGSPAHRPQGEHMVVLRHIMAPGTGRGLNLKPITPQVFPSQTKHSLRRISQTSCPPPWGPGMHQTLGTITNKFNVLTNRLSHRMLAFWPCDIFYDDHVESFRACFTDFNLD